LQVPTAFSSVLQAAQTQTSLLLSSSMVSSSY